MLLRFLQVGQSVILQELWRFRESGPSPLEIVDEGLLCLRVRGLLFAQKGMQSENEKVEMEVELDAHGLGVARAHGDRYELCKFDEKLLSLTLIEMLYHVTATARRSFLRSSCVRGFGLVCRQQSRWKASRVSM